MRSRNSEDLPFFAKRSTASLLQMTQAPFPGKSAANRGCNIEHGVRIIEGLPIRGAFGDVGEAEGSRASLSFIMNAEFDKKRINESLSRGLTRERKTDMRA